MTQGTAPLRKDYTGNGVQTQWAYDWKIYANTELTVTKVTIATGVESTLIVGVDYTVTGLEDPAGGFVVISPALSSLYSLVITPNLNYGQDADFTNQNSIPPVEVEEALDKLSRQIKQLAEESSRGIKAGIGAPLDTNEITGTIDTSPRVLTVTSSGVQTATLGSVSTDIDTIFTGLATDDGLFWNGTNWVNKNIAQVSNGSITSVASATTIVLNSTTTNYFNITGTTTITGITLAEGVEVTAKFAGILTLTNGANLINISGANITTAAGDIAVFRGEAAGVVRMIDYVRADGKAVSASALVYLGSATASASASLDFTSLITSTYDTYFITYTNILPVTNNVIFMAQTSSNNGVSWETVSAQTYMYSGNVSNAANTFVGGTGGAANGLWIANAVRNNGLVGCINGFSYLYRGTSGNYGSLYSNTTYLDNSNFINLKQYICTVGGGGQENAIRFIMSSGNIASGTVRLYGVSKS